jgi:hypothetical protein
MRTSCMQTHDHLTPVERKGCLLNISMTEGCGSLKFLFEIFGHCLKINPQKQNSWEHGIITSQQVAKYLWWWPRGTAYQPRRKQTKHVKEWVKTAKAAKSWTVRGREPGLPMGLAPDCPGLRAGLSGVQLPKTERRETVLDRAEQQWRTVWAQAADCPQVKNQKTNSLKQVLDLAENERRTVCGYARTVRRSEQWNTTQKQTSVRGVNSNNGLSTAHWQTVWESRISKNRAPEKSPPLKLPSICGQISTNCLQNCYTRSQASRWAISKRSLLNLKPINGKSNENEKHSKTRSRNWFAPIYELVRNWMKSFGRKAQPTS